MASFCVEQGRWSRRGGEPMQYFVSAAAMVATKELKTAVRAKASQAEVWGEVAKTQEALSRTVGGVVRADRSPTSLQLSLEDKRVNQALENYLKILSKAPDGKSDVLGFAFSINGEINSGDVYASPDLFRKLWPKLVRASAVEAAAKARKDRKFQAPTAEAVHTALTTAHSGKEVAKDVNHRVRLVTRESEKYLLFESRDRAAGDAWVHRNYLTK